MIVHEGGAAMVKGECGVEQYISWREVGIWRRRAEEKKSNGKSTKEFGDIY